MDRSFALAVGERDARRIVLLCIAAAVLAGCIGYAVNQHFAKPQTFDQWWEKHQQTCEQCGGSPDHAMCEEAFAKLQEELRNH